MAQQQRNPLRLQPKKPGQQPPSPSGPTPGLPTRGPSKQPRR